MRVLSYALLEASLSVVRSDYYDLPVHYVQVDATIAITQRT
jgi:hypothetical protein